MRFEFLNLKKSNVSGKSSYVLIDWIDLFGPFFLIHSGLHWYYEASQNAQSNERVHKILLVTSAPHK